MHHGNLQHEGAWSFGSGKRGFETTPKNEVPGPGAHTLPVSKMSPSWTSSKDSRLKPLKHTGVAVGTYNPEQHLVHPSAYMYGFGTSSRPNPTNSTLTKEINCYPSEQLTRTAIPAYSMGWKDTEKADNGIPAPGTYFSDILTSPKSANKSDIILTTSNRTDFTRKNRNPAVGSYEVTVDSLSPSVSFTKSRRPNVTLNPNPEPGAYQVAGSMWKPSQGKTFGNKLPLIAKKDDNPSPDKYFPPLPKHNGSIFMYQSNRTSPTNKDAATFPSPGAYEISGSLEKEIHIGRGKRADIAPPKLGPGPGTYELENPRSTQFGVINSPSVMSPSGKPYTGPAPWAYSPKNILTERRGSDTLIGLTSNRQDFSKSPTKALGPGAYQISKKFDNQLGKFGISQRLVHKKSESPGPGQYNFPPTIGRIPKYYQSLSKKVGEYGQVKHVKYDPKQTAKAKLESILNRSPQKA